jgi:cytochrome oxidase Cu insertion factor (SCO1/SenC/PrrC family)
MNLARRIARVAFMAVALTLSVLAAGCGSSDPGQATGGQATVDRTAPDFKGTTIDGEAVSLSGFRGKPTLLVFWASW